MYPDTWGKSGIPYDRYPFHTYYADGSAISEEVLQVKLTSNVLECYRSKGMNWKDIMMEQELNVL